MWHEIFEFSKLSVKYYIVSINKMPEIRLLIKLVKKSKTESDCQLEMSTLLLQSFLFSTVKAAMRHTWKIKKKIILISWSKYWIKYLLDCSIVGTNLQSLTKFYRFFTVRQSKKQWCYDRITALKNLCDRLRKIEIWDSRKDLDLLSWFNPLCRSSSEARKEASRNEFMIIMTTPGLFVIRDWIFEYLSLCEAFTDVWNELWVSQK